MIFWGAPMTMEPPNICGSMAYVIEQGIPLRMKLGMSLVY